MPSTSVSIRIRDALKALLEGIVNCGVVTKNSGTGTFTVMSTEGSNYHAHKGIDDLLTVEIASESGGVLTDLYGNTYTKGVPTVLGQADGRVLTLNWTDPDADMVGVELAWQMGEARASHTQGWGAYLSHNVGIQHVHTDAVEKLELNVWPFALISPPRTQLDDDSYPTHKNEQVRTIEVWSKDPTGDPEMFMDLLAESVQTELLLNRSLGGIVRYLDVQEVVHVGNSAHEGFYGVLITLRVVFNHDSLNAKQER